MRIALTRNEDGSPNFDTRELFAPPGGTMSIITRAVLREHLKQLFDASAEVAILHFSGHGTVNNLDGYLVTQDAANCDEGVAMTEVLQMANQSKAQEVVIFLDCCFSGKLGNPPVVDNTKTFLREGVSILTGSRGDEPSVETGGGGVFTTLVVSALEGGAADLLGSVTAPAVYAYVEAALGAWDQRPLFKSHVSRVLPLRRCTPPIELATIRSLPELFPLPAEDLPLTPAHEPESPSPDASKVSAFRKLQALSRVHLVAPVGAAYMYWAAMESKACRLTPAGRYYWRLAKDGRV
jgi:hypothetical protein